MGLLAVFALRGGRVPSPLRPVLLKIQNALAAFKGATGGRALSTALALSFVFQGSQVLLNYGLARVVGLPLSLTTVCWVTPALALASLLPVGIGGLGMREAAALALLGTSVAGGGASAGVHHCLVALVAGHGLAFQRTGRNLGAGAQKVKP